MDNQRVQIHFRTINRLPDARETVPWESPQCNFTESRTEGEYYEKGEAHYCLYEEQPEGWDEPCKVMLKWKNNLLERHIRGEAASHLVFEQGRCHRNFYHTPFGDLTLETETRRLAITEERDAIFLVLEYDIRQDGQNVSENRMEIHIQGIEKGI